MTKIIGLTGGIGSGKTTVAKYLASKGIPVYIADKEAKQVIKNKAVLNQIKDYFGSSVFHRNGKLNRKALADIVFNDKDRLKELNNIVHPHVKLHFKEWLKAYENFDFIIKEVAILFETKGHLECDKVILVTAPEETRINRVMQRDNCSYEDVLARMKNQMPEEQKKRLADFIIENIDKEETFKKLDELLINLKDCQ